MLRPFSGSAGQAIVRSAPSASSRASLTGPMLPRSVELKVEQYLNRICRAPRARSHASAASELTDRLWSAGMVRDLSATTTAWAVAGIDPVLGHADQLHRRHAVAHQHAGEIGGAGEIVRDAAEQDRHAGSLVWLPPGSF